MVSIRRLSDKTLAKYQQIIADGGELTPRQKKALQGHALITNEAFVTALLRPDLINLTDGDLSAAEVAAATVREYYAYNNGKVYPPRRPDNDGRWA